PAAESPAAPPRESAHRPPRRTGRRRTCAAWRASPHYWPSEVERRACRAPRQARSSGSRGDEGRGRSGPAASPGPPPGAATRKAPERSVRRSCRSPSSPDAAPFVSLPGQFIGQRLQVPTDLLVGRVFPFKLVAAEDRFKVGQHRLEFLLGRLGDAVG